MHGQIRLNQRLRELDEQDASQEMDSGSSGSGSASQATETSLNWVTGWFRFSTGPEKAKQPAQLTPEQKEKLRRARRESQAKTELGPSPSPPTAPKGLYLHGSVGSGKSLLMDLFYDSVANTIPQLEHHRRVHFNAAMLEVHLAVQLYQSVFVRPCQ